MRFLVFDLTKKWKKKKKNIKNGVNITKIIIKSFLFPFKLTKKKKKSTKINPKYLISIKKIGNLTPPKFFFGYATYWKWLYTFKLCLIWMCHWE